MEGYKSKVRIGGGSDTVFCSISMMRIPVYNANRMESLALELFDRNPDIVLVAES
jgi:hypothetical protein